MQSASDDVAEDGRRSRAGNLESADIRSSGILTAEDVSILDLKGPG